MTLIIVSVISNAAERITAAILMIVALKGIFDLAMAVASGGEAVIDVDMFSTPSLGFDRSGWRWFSLFLLVVTGEMLDWRQEVSHLMSGMTLICNLSTVRVYCWGYIYSLR
jgi:hypothetical protein